jgi:CRP-like cAMP-binding protein
MALELDVLHIDDVIPLSLLDREALRLLAFSGDKRRLRAGDVLFRKGEASRGGAVVLSGSIAMDAANDGSQAAMVVGPGGLIGELALLLPTEHEAQAIARENSEVLMISRHLFKRVLEEYPHNAVKIHKAYSERLQELNVRVRHVGRKLDRLG